MREPVAAIVLERPVCEAALAEALAGTAPRVVEAGACEAAPCAPAGRAQLVLSTASAFALPLAKCLIDGAARRFAVTLRDRDGTELALHEAIANAVLRGNLDTKGLDRTSAAAMAAFSAEIDARLNDPDFGERSVETNMWVEADEIVFAVRDAGAGYEAAACAEAAGTVIRAGGRGLALMRAFARAIDIDESGRQVTIRAALCP